MTNVISTSFSILICAIKELEITKCPTLFLKRCMHETDKFNAWNKYNFQPFSWGKYGAIGKLSRDGEQIKVGETSLVVKTNRHPIKDIKIKFLDNTLVLDDNIAEIVFAALINILYDVGACPFYVRYAGYFLKQPVVYLFSEKCSFEFSHILQRRPDGSSIVVKKPHLLMNCIFQMIYAVYVYKAYFNLIHFDTHIRNVMLKTKSREHYQDISWSECKYIIFRDKRTSRAIVIKNYNYIVKLLDFGLCFASLNKTPLTDSTIRVESHINAHKFVDTPSKANTVDIMYFLLHVYQYMNFGLDKNFGSTTTNFSEDRRYFSHLLKIINEFSTDFFGKPFSDFSNVNVPDRNSEGKLLYLLKQHNVGVESDLFRHRQGLMEGLIRYCTASGCVRNSCVVDNAPGYSIFSHEPIPDFVFEKKHCMFLDAGIAMRETRPAECQGSVQWWSTEQFEDACRSTQQCTTDCNIMYWTVTREGRSLPGRKMLVISASRRPHCPSLSMSKVVSLENGPPFSKDFISLEKIVYQNGQPKHFLTDAYKKRNFIATLIGDDSKLVVICFGSHYGDISLSKACDTFSKLKLCDVYQFFNDVSICFDYKNRTTRIVGTPLSGCTTIKLRVTED